MSQIREDNKIGQCPLCLKIFFQEAKKWKDVLGKEKTLIIEESIGQWTVSLTNKTKNFHLETKQEEMIGQCPLFLKIL